MMIFSSIKDAIEDVFRPGAMKVLGLGVALSVGLLLLLTVLFTWGVGAITPDSFTLPFTQYKIGFIDDIASLATIGLMLMMSIFLMIPVASAFTGLFLEDVAALVEEAHYPDLPQIRKFTLAETIADSLRFLGVVILANIIAFTVYFFILPFAPLLFFGLNGYLLGREYFQMAAARRLQKEQVQALYQKYRWKIWGTGALMAVVLTIPIVNLVVPVLGAATFTHLYHRLTGQVPRLAG